jgi:hypothetical protein
MRTGPYALFQYSGFIDTARWVRPERLRPRPGRRSRLRGKIASWPGGPRGLRVVEKEGHDEAAVDTSRGAGREAGPRAMAGGHPRWRSVAVCRNYHQSRAGLSAAGAIIDDADDTPSRSPTSGLTASRRLAADDASPAGKRESLRPVKWDEAKGGRS